MKKAYLVFSALSDLKSARKIARMVLEQRLCACVHLSGFGESHYWWKGRLETEREVGMTFKTVKKTLPLLLQTIKEVHPYETPEILALPVEKGSKSYLAWLEKETSTRSKPKKTKS